MGVGEAVFYGSLIFAAVAVLVVAGALRINGRRKPRDLSDTIAEQIEQAADTADQHVDIWQSLNRQCQAGDNWPEHNEDADEDGCWCRSCYAVEIKRLQDAEIGELFAGLVDTPELRDLADRAERGLR